MSTQMVTNESYQLITDAYTEGLKMGKYHVRNKIDKIIKELKEQEQDYFNWDNYDAANAIRYAIDAIEEALND